MKLNTSGGGSTCSVPGTVLGCVQTRDVGVIITNLQTWKLRFRVALSDAPVHKICQDYSMLYIFVALLH